MMEKLKNGFLIFLGFLSSLLGLVLFKLLRSNKKLRLDNLEKEIENDYMEKSQEFDDKSLDDIIRDHNKSYHQRRK